MGLDKPAGREVLVRCNVLWDDDAKVDSTRNKIFVFIVLDYDGVPLVAADEKLGLFVEDDFFPRVLLWPFESVRNDERDSSAADVEGGVRFQEEAARERRGVFRSGFIVPGMNDDAVRVIDQGDLCFQGALGRSFARLLRRLPSEYVHERGHVDGDLPFTTVAVVLADWW